MTDTERLDWLDKNAYFFDTTGTHKIHFVVSFKMMEFQEIPNFRQAINQAMEEEVCHRQG